MSRKTAVLPILLCLSLRSFAQGSEGGLVSGDDWGILVSAPPGWVQDLQAYRPAGIEALFRREGERYSASALHIAIGAKPRAAAIPGGLAKFLEDEKSSLAASDRDVAIRELPAYAPGMEYRFAMRELDDPGKGIYRALAYYEGGKAFFSFVLSCRSPEEREKERGALLELLDSFVYLSKER
jgi:hypothetical protein